MSCPKGMRVRVPPRAPMYIATNVSYTHWFVLAGARTVGRKLLGAVYAILVQPPCAFIFLGGKLAASAHEGVPPRPPKSHMLY